MQAQAYAEQQTRAAAAPSESASSAAGLHHGDHSRPDSFAALSAPLWAGASRSVPAEEWHHNFAASPALQPPPLVDRQLMSPTEASAIDSPFRTIAAGRTAVQGGSAACVPRPADGAREFAAQTYAQHPADDVMWQRHSAAAAVADMDLLRRLDYGMHAMTPELRAASGSAAFGALRPPSVYTHEHSSETFSRHSAETIDAIVPHLMERAERRRLRRLAEETAAAAETQSLLESPPLEGPSQPLTAQVLQMVQHGAGQRGSAAVAAAGPAAAPPGPATAAAPELAGRWVAQTASASSSWASGHHAREHGDSGGPGTRVQSTGSVPWARHSEAGASPLDRSLVPSPAVSAPQLDQVAAVPRSGSPASSVRRLSFERQPAEAAQSGGTEQQHPGWQTGGALHMVRITFARTYAEPHPVVSLAAWCSVCECGFGWNAMLGRYKAERIWLHMRGRSIL